MSEFDWTYDIEADVIYIGSKFRIDATTVINYSREEYIDVQNWLDGEFIEFEISWIGTNDEGSLEGYGLDEKIIVLVINDCKMPENSPYSEPGYRQTVHFGRVRELIEVGYWRSI